MTNFLIHAVIYLPVSTSDEFDAITVKVKFRLITFIKVNYPTYSHYLKSFQASGQLKDLKFDTMVEKIVVQEKTFGKKSV